MLQLQFIAELRSVTNEKTYASVRTFFEWFLRGKHRFYCGAPDSAALYFGRLTELCLALADKVPPYVLLEIIEADERSEFFSFAQKSKHVIKCYATVRSVHEGRCAGAAKRIN